MAGWCTNFYISTYYMCHIDMNDARRFRSEKHLIGEFIDFQYNAWEI